MLQTTPSRLDQLAAQIFEAHAKAVRSAQSTVAWAIEAGGGAVRSKGCRRTRQLAPLAQTKLPGVRAHGSKVHAPRRKQATGSRPNPERRSVFDNNQGGVGVNLNPPANVIRG